MTLYNFDYRQIKILRKKYGFKQLIVADEIGTVRSNYSRKENGKTPFYAEEFFRIAEFFKDKVDTSDYLHLVGPLLPPCLIPKPIVGQPTITKKT